MDECVFCRIVEKEIPADIQKETDDFLVFPDINPSAPLHLLIVPKKHFNDINDVSDEIWRDVKEIALSLAREKSLGGFRLANNAGDAALVKHFHVHFLGGISAKEKI